MTEWIAREVPRASMHKDAVQTMWTKTEEGGVLEQKTGTGKATRPAMRWRNRWCVNVRYQNSYDGQWVGPGEYWGAFVWPSREIAEQIAHEDLERHASLKRAMNDSYLGALPVDK